MKTFTRRSFIKRSAVTAAAVSSLPFPTFTQEISPSDEIRTAVVGFRGRGQDHIRGLLSIKGVRVTALCDVDKNVLDREVQNFTDGKEENELPSSPPSKGFKYPRIDVGGYTDIRKLLESKNVDAISVATPNHWHALAAVWAIQAGKDVYLEKPVSHNVWEGRKIVEAARKHGKIVQTGTQTRSSVGIRECFEWLREGNLGKITLARGLCYKPRPSIGKTTGPQPVPAGVDYDLWSGPAPIKPVRRAKFHYDWHWFWDYGSGDLGNQGIHQMDISRWALGVKELSPRVLSLGGRLGYEDDGETANTQIVYHDYSPAPLLFEVRGLPEKAGAKNMDKYPSKEPGKGGSVCVVVHCEGGYVLVPDYNDAIVFDKEGNQVRVFKGSSKGHFENFIKAVRSRKVSDLNADILEGHLSSALCHTGNISYRLGAPYPPEQIHEALQDDKDAAEAFERMVEHLKANNVDLNVTRAKLGLALKMDPKTERFVGNDKANAMLTRDYRKPYFVPEKV